MFRIRLVLVRGESRWQFRVGMTFRIVSAVIALAILYAGLLLDTLAVPLVLAGLALLGAFYEETAVFDRQRGVEFRWGLVPLHRTKRFRFDEIAEVRVSTFGPARFVSLEVGMRDGSVLTVENDRGKPSAERMAVWGRELADWLEVPFLHETET